jgi:hypothetical protein
MKALFSHALTCVSEESKSKMSNLKLPIVSGKLKK